jgi:hypothetical protein
VEKTLSSADHGIVVDENGDRKDAYLDCGIETVNGSDVLLRRLGRQAREGQGWHRPTSCSMPSRSASP